MKFLARQPILDRNRELFAYELLFRSGMQNFCDQANLENASASMLDTSFLIGLQRLTGGQRAFINCPRDFLLMDYISLFPSDYVVVELLENITPDKQVIDACRRLKLNSYLLALDDFVGAPDWDPLVKIADFIKVDFRDTSRLEQKALAARYAGKGVRMLAEKVETQQEYLEAMDMGYSLFQGYFFCRPEIIRQRAIPSRKLAYLELLHAAASSKFDINVLASKIGHEPSLTFKLFRFLNSAAFGLRAEVHSISQALHLLGEREVRKWIAVVFVGVMAEGKPDELMTVPLVRGRFCELIAQPCKMVDQSSDLFLLGLLSVMDAILDQPLDLVLEELPVRHEIKEALLQQSVPYRRFLDLAIALECADWSQITALASDLNVQEEVIFDTYASAVEWATALRQGTPATVAV